MTTHTGKDFEKEWWLKYFGIYVQEYVPPGQRIDRKDCWLVTQRRGTGQEFATMTYTKTTWDLWKTFCSVALRGRDIDDKPEGAL